MFETLKSIDRAIFLAMNGWHASWLDGFMYAVSQIWLFAPVFLYVAYLVYKDTGAKKLLASFLALALVIVLADQASNRTKHAVERYRPTHNLEIGPLVHTVTDFSGHEYRGGQFGFFSGHAANTFGVAVFLCLVLRHRPLWLRIVLIAWAVLTSYSRIYLGVHYPSDILVGTITGVLVGYLVFLLYSWVTERYPDWFAS